MVTMLGEWREAHSIYNAGVDWLTMTYKADEYDVFMRAMTAVSALMGIEEINGAETKETKLRDYTGIQCGRLYSGARADSYIIQASSDVADALARFCVANGCEGKTTRIDMQATIQFNQDCPHIAIETHRQIRELKASDAWPQTLGLSLYETGGRGDSLFIGSRSSEIYRRIYDKTREQNFRCAHWLWRWEVEYKGMRARQVMVTLLGDGNTGATAQNLVGTEFKKLGIPREWMFHVKHSELAPLSTPTDDEKRLRWLEKMVRPTLRKLRNNGRGDDALDALSI